MIVISNITEISQWLLGLKVSIKKCATNELNWLNKKRLGIVTSDYAIEFVFLPHGFSNERLCVEQWMITNSNFPLRSLIAPTF